MGLVVTGLVNLMMAFVLFGMANDSQVRIGVGTFKHSTGITDSAYTHAVHEVIYRPPTAAELIGINRDDYPYDINSATKSGSDGEKKDLLRISSTR